MIKQRHHMIISMTPVNFDVTPERRDHLTRFIFRFGTLNQFKKIFPFLSPKNSVDFIKEIPEFRKYSPEFNEFIQHWREMFDN